MKASLILRSLSLFVVAQCGMQAIAQTTFTVPGVHTYSVGTGVTALQVDMMGATGGWGSTFISHGGNGGRVQCNLAVTAGQVLQINVGGVGADGTSVAAGIGGINGGGDGGYAYNPYGGGGGGGASDIRITPYFLANRQVVAAGGGGGGHDYSSADADKGGYGGGLSGGAGYHASVLDAKSGQGATPTTGGAGGVYSGWPSGTAGTDSVGGTGGATTGGGGGGGGYWCGGGGSWGGGGGGSSYTAPLVVTSVTHTQDYNSAGDGSVTVTMMCETPVAGTITGTTTLCAGGQTSSLANTSGSTYGYWSSTNLAVATVGSTSGVITSGVSGTTTISYIATTACGTSATATAVVTVNALPSSGTITGADNVCPALTVTLANTASGGLWSSSNTAIASVDAASGVVTGVAAGAATISYTVTVSGCSTFATKGITVNSPSVCPNEVNSVYTSGARLKIAPNPSAGTFAIKLSSATNERATVTILNTLGQRVLQTTVSCNKEELISLNVPAGVYFINAATASGKWNEMIVIK